MKSVFPDILLIMCFFHFTLNITSKMSKRMFPSKIIKKSEYLDNLTNFYDLKKEETNVIFKVKLHIDYMRYLPTKKLFDKFFEIVNPFWAKYCKLFLDYFKKTYVNTDGLTGWQSFIKFRMPSTNNSLEALNKQIKSQVTNYQKMELADFMDKLFSYIKDKSLENLKIEEFPSFPLIENSFWIISQYLVENFDDYFVALENSEQIYIKDKDPLFNYYYNGKIAKKIKLFINNEENKSEILEKFEKPTLIQIKLLNEPKYIKSYEEIIDIIKIRKIEIIEEDITYSSCYCPTFFTRGICPHILACLLHKNLIMKPISIGTNKKRGRPKKVVRGLLYDID